MYYGGIGALGAGRPSRPSESATSTSADVRNPYQKLALHMHSRVEAIRAWAEYCVEMSQSLYKTLGYGNQSAPTIGQEGLVNQTNNVLTELVRGELVQQMSSYEAKFIVTTLDNMQGSDPEVVEKARAYLKCFNNLTRAMRRHVTRMEGSILTTIEQKGLLSNTRAAVKGLADGCASILDQWLGCAEQTYPAYWAATQAARGQWETARAEALDAQAAAEEYAAAMRAQAERMAAAAQEAAQQTGPSVESQEAYQQQQAAEAAAAAAEAQAEQAADTVEQMDTEADAVDAASFPWWMVGVGVATVAVAGAVIYFGRG